MRVLLTILTLVLAPSCFAEWEKMVSNGGIVIYIDPQTIKITGGKRSVLALVAYSDVLPNGARSVRGSMEFDCRERRLRTLTFSQYSEPLAQGRLLSDSAVPTEWSAVMPDTFAADGLDYVCRK